MTTTLKLAIANDAHAGDQAAVLADTVAEMQRQVKKWGVQNHGTAMWLAILTEEVGEAAKEICDSPMVPTRNLYRELIQIAAVAASAAQCIRRNNPLSVPEDV